MNGCKWMLPANANARAAQASNSNVIFSAPGVRSKWTSARIAEGIGSTRGNWLKSGWRRASQLRTHRLGKQAFHPRSSGICTGCRQTAAREVTAIELAGGVLKQ